MYEIRWTTDRRVNGMLLGVIEMQADAEGMARGISALKPNAFYRVTRAGVTLNIYKGGLPAPVIPRVEP